MINQACVKLLERGGGGAKQSSLPKGWVVRSHPLHPIPSDGPQLERWNKIIFCGGGGGGEGTCFLVDDFIY